MQDIEIIAYMVDKLTKKKSKNEHILTFFPVDTNFTLNENSLLPCNYWVLL